MFRGSLECYQKLESTRVQFLCFLKLSELLVGYFIV